MMCECVWCWCEHVFVCSHVLKKCAWEEGEREEGKEGGREGRREEGRERREGVYYANSIFFFSVDEGFDEHDIPYDVLWLDIEHTDGKK